MTQPLEIAMTSKEIGLEVVRLIGLAWLAIGLAAVCGRILDVKRLHTPWPFFGDPGMAFITGIGFILGGVAFFILARRYDG